MENLVQSPSHYVWEVAGKPISIHLDFNVVDRLGMDVMKGFGAIPKRGAEVGGLLLGSIDDKGGVVVRVEGFVPVICDYMRGPSYQLTENDEARFREATEKAMEASGSELKLVGIYRSHTRDGLSLADEDLQRFNDYCGGPNQIILLVRPFASRTSIGAFFFQENGGFRRESSYQEFPFKRRDLGGGTSTPIRSQAAEAPPIVKEAYEPQGPDLREWVKSRNGDGKPLLPRAENAEGEPRPSAAQFNSKWVWLPLSFVFLVLGVVAGFQSALMLNKDGLERAFSNNAGLELSAKVEDEKIMVRWDRSAAAIQNAASGTLRIVDGEFSKVVNLDSRQLQNGSVIYMNAENTVNFRLDVTTRQKTNITESVSYVPPKN